MIATGSAHLAIQRRVGWALGALVAVLALWNLWFRGLTPGDARP